MKWFGILILVFGTIKLLSYAKYNWNKKNKLGAIGCITLMVLSLLVPLLLLWR